MKTRTGGINSCDYSTAQNKRTVFYGDGRTLGYLIAATKKSQHISLNGATIVA